jgi:hypothetical protein
MEEKETTITEGKEKAKSSFGRMFFSKKSSPKKRADVGLIVLMILAVLAIFCIIIVAILSKWFFAGPLFTDFFSSTFLM